MIEVLEYVDGRGRVPYRDWVVTLDKTTQVRIVTAVLRLEQGNVSSVKGVGLGVSELRLDFGPGYRIYFGRVGGELVVLLGGGSKRRQQRDIGEAQSLWAEHNRRKLEG